MGVGRGQWGEGCIGNTIKDTRTKSRGRVKVGEGGVSGCGGVEGRGENADNCNRIKINKKNKNKMMKNQKKNNKK